MLFLDAGATFEKNWQELCLSIKIGKGVYVQQFPLLPKKLGERKAKYKTTKNDYTLKIWALLHCRISSSVLAATCSAVSGELEKILLFLSF